MGKIIEIALTTASAIGVGNAETASAESEE
jgi:hypothetical protein